VSFAGGFESTTILMQSISYELAKNPDILQTLIDEVDEMLSKLNGKAISYDQLNSMRFLDIVVNETLRKWPAFITTSRNCNEDFNLEDEETGKVYKIRKGTRVWIPIIELQMDPKYFPNPEKFDPYRFSSENKSKIQTGTFIPFGIGPRMCIGNRYTLLVAKLLLFTVMSTFTIEKSSKTPKNVTYSKGMIGFNEKIFLALTLRTKN
jgi:cytochrome P450 family 9